MTIVGSGSRLPALDGLRGIAALGVVTFHAAMVDPRLADVVDGRGDATGWAAIATYTPVRLLWAGQEAVLVFFVLSGLVLTLPFMHRGFDASAYYPRRLIRIYVPVWGAVALALGWAYAVPRESAVGASWWVNGHDFPLTAQGLGGDATLLLGTTWIDSVLWSLRWEMWFSLLLPLYLVVLVRHRRWPVAKLALLLATSEFGSLVHLDYLRYLPVFGIGVLLASESVRIATGCRRLGRWTGLVVVVSLVVLLEARWVTGRVVSVATVLAAAALVAAFVVWPPAARWGRSAPALWLGRISFSLYLVHEPVVTSVAVRLDTRSPFLVLAVALPASLALALAFYRLVELPSHRLARHIDSGVRTGRATRTAGGSRIEALTAVWAGNAGRPT